MLDESLRLGRMGVHTTWAASRRVDSDRASRDIHHSSEQLGIEEERDDPMDERSLAHGAGEHGHVRMCGVQSPRTQWRSP